MNRRILALLCAAACVAGCSAHSVEGVTCDSNSDCNGGTCQNNVCVGAGTNAGSGSTGSGSTSGSSGSSGSSGTTGVFECDGGCTIPEYCDTGVGRCKTGYTVRFLTPSDAGLWVDGGQQTARVRVTFVAESGFGDPDSVQLQVSLGADAGCAGPITSLTKGPSPGPSASTWSGDWNPADVGVVVADAPVTLCASAFVGDAGVGQDLTVVNVDVTPPSVNPTAMREPDDDVEPGFTEAYARDEDPLTFDSGAADTGSGLASVTFELVYSDGGAVPGVTMTASGTPPSADLNLQDPPLADHGAFFVQATAVDNVGNTATEQSQRVRITRWKWVADSGFTSGLGAALQTPAVDDNGTVYTVNGNGSMNVFAFNGRDGGMVLPPASVPGAPTLPPAIGPVTDDHLFVAQNQNSSVTVVSLGDGGVITTQTLDNGLNAMAVGHGTDSNAASVDVAFVASTTGLLWGVQASETVAFSDFTPDPLCAAPNVCGSASAKIIGVYATGQNGESANFGAILRQTQVAGPTIVTPELASVSARTNGPGFRNPSVVASLSESPVIGPVGGEVDAYFGGGLGNILGHVDTGAGQESPDSGLTLSDAIAGEPVIDAAGQVYVALANGGIVRTSVTGSNWGPLAQDPIDGSGGLLLARDNLYAVSNSSSAIVTVIPLASFGGSAVPGRFHIPLGSVGGPSAPPALMRTTNNRSLLLVPTNSGQLIALVVDDPGFDPNAIWPKARRDSFNSANVAFPISTYP